jgi:TolA-binding protein
MALVNRSLRKTVLRVLSTMPLMLVMAAGVMATTKKTNKVNLGDVKAEKIAKKGTEKAKSSRLSANEAFLVATETRLLSEITKAIDYLAKQSERMPKKSATRLEMRERLVNLRLEGAVYYANQEMRKYDKLWEAWDRGGRKGPEPKLDESKSKGEWENLARDAQSVLDEYPRSKNADVIMFNMGLANNFLKRDKQAARIFSQLIAKYPNSQKAGDAYFSLGDFYFDKSDFSNAMNNYKNALKFKQSKSYTWSMFKLGWCNYNLGQPRQALSYWKATVTEANRNGKKGLALRDEALRDMVYAFAELKEVEPAIAYYKANGGDKYIGRFLLLLSDTFSDQGQYAEAIRVLRRYQQVAPLAADVPDTQKSIIGLYYELGMMPNVWQELERYPRLFGPNSQWAEHNKSEKKVYDEVQQTIKDQIIYYAKLTHKNAQKDDNKRLYAEALKGYNLFLRSYPKAREQAEVKYNMADIYYFTKQFREAGKLYLDISLLGKDKAVIYDAKTNKATSIHKQSADYMLDSYYQVFEPELKTLVKNKPDFQKGSPRPISENGRNFIKACDYYTKTYPGEKKNVKTCDVYITEIFYRSNDKKMAEKYLLMMAKKYPNDKEGQEAVENLIPIYGKDEKALQAVIAELRKIPAYQKGKIGEKLEGLEHGLAVDSIKTDKNACTRAKKGEDLFKKRPNAKDNDALVYNAALDWEKCNKVPDAIRDYTIVLQKYPKSEGAKPALLKLGLLHKNRLELAAAAKMFAEFAAKYPKEKESAGALSETCELQAALNSEGAVNACLAFGAVDQQGAKSVFFRMLRAAYSAGEEGRVLGLAKVLDGKFKLSPDERIQAYTAVMNSKGGSAQQAAAEILTTFQRSGGNVSGEALRSVGGLVFRRVNPILAQFTAMRLHGGTVDALVASIQAKAGALAKVQAAYEQVLATKDAYWGVAAFYQLGYARENLAKDLENPPDITGAPHADVVKQLAGDAKSARGEAKVFYAKALDAVSRFLVYNEWAARSLSGMARIQGKTIYFDDLIVKPDFLGAEVPENIAQAVKGKGD